MGRERRIFFGSKIAKYFLDWNLPLTAIYGRMALFVRLSVELIINLYGVWMFDVLGGKWFIFNVATEEVNNRYPSRSGQIAHIWCQGPQASPTSLYSIWSEYWEELTDFGLVSSAGWIHTTVDIILGRYSPKKSVFCQGLKAYSVYVLVGDERKKNVSWKG